MSESMRRDAIERGKFTNASSGLFPSAFGPTVFHRQTREKSSTASDQFAAPNNFGIADSICMDQIEADMTMLRMAELNIDNKGNHYG